VEGEEARELGAEVGLIEGTVRGGEGLGASGGLVEGKASILLVAVGCVIAVECTVGAIVGTRTGGATSVVVAVVVVVVSEVEAASLLGEGGW